MKAKNVRMIVMAAAAAGMLVLGGCGSKNVNAVQESDSVIQSVTEAVNSTPLTLDPVTDSGADVIAPQEIQPNAITPTPDSTEVPTEPESTTESPAVGAEESESTPAETAEESVGYTVAGINLRDDASSDGDVVNTIEPGEKVTIIGSTDGNWTRVRYDGEEGYVATKYLTSDESEARTAKANYYDDDDYDEDEE